MGDIRLKPQDNYIELEFTSYKDVDKLLSECYPNDMDIEFYPGVLVDNYIGYMPNFARSKPQNADIIVTTNKRHFNYVVVLENYINEWQSSQMVYFRDDEDFVNAIRIKLEQD